MLSREDARRQMYAHFMFSPTDDQKQVIDHFSAFEVSQKENPLYILKGYAGTGKTTLVSTYVKMLSAAHKKYVLLAPTGRAAKVLAQYTGKKAHTIHRFIYRFYRSPDGNAKFLLAPNTYSNTVFFIDEASMIGDQNQSVDSLFNSRSLLEDLLVYVYSNENNKLIFVGDTAQLPPVGLDISPALLPDYFRSIFNVAAYAFELKEVMRQSLDSGILSVATSIRHKIADQITIPPFFDTSQFKTDVVKITSGEEFEETLQSIYSSGEINLGIVVCRTNKRANLFNKQIRNYILQKETDIEGGDLMMVVKNNYYWLDETSKAGFIANGDLIEIIRLKRTFEMYGFHFAEAEINLLDYPDEKEHEVILLLDTIDSEGPGLTEENRQLLFQRVEEDYSDIPQRRKRIAMVQKNPYYNALHVKFAYALTCHKTQGGQWPFVIVDQGYLNEDMINIEYLRWLYTAVTRATKKLFLVNFNHDLFC